MLEGYRGFQYQDPVTRVNQCGFQNEGTYDIEDFRGADS